MLGYILYLVNKMYLKNDYSFWELTFGFCLFKFMVRLFIFLSRLLVINCDSLSMFL